MGVFTTLSNIGEALEAQLFQVGIETPIQLEELGSKEAWIRIKMQDPSACLNRLCALEGAIRGMRWHLLPQEVKDDLKSFYWEVKGSENELE